MFRNLLALLFLTSCFAAVTSLSPALLRAKEDAKKDKQTAALLPPLSKAQLAFIEKDHPKAVTDFVKLKATLKDEQRVFVEAWFPDVLGLNSHFFAESSDQRIDLAKVSRAPFKKLAAEWFKNAEAMAKADLPASASWEMRRVLALDPTHAKAAKALGYEKCNDKNYRHSRYKSLEDKGLTYSEYGWLSKKSAKSRKSGLVPEGHEWVAAKDADAKHEKWGDARELEFTYVKIRSNLPIEKVSPIGTLMDEHLENWRARLHGNANFTEPNWPLVINITRTSDEFASTIKARGMGEAGTPFGIYYPLLREAFVCDETCAQSFETTRGIAMHEITHALLFAVFPGASQTPQIPYGWMAEAAAASVYYFDGSNPSNHSLIEKVQKKSSSPESPHHLAYQKAINETANELGRLNSIDDYSESSGDLQAYIGGALFINWGLSQLAWREATVTWIASTQSFKAQKGDFEKLLGESQAISKAVALWAAAEFKEK